MATGSEGTKASDGTSGTGATDALMSAPAFAAGLLQTATAQAMSQAAQNATFMQSMGQSAMLAATARGVSTILGQSDEQAAMYKALISKLEQQA